MESNQVCFKVCSSALECFSVPIYSVEDCLPQRRPFCTKLALEIVVRTSVTALAMVNSILLDSIYNARCITVGK